MGQMKGKASIEFEHPPVIISAGSVVGKKEGEGPLGSLFDEVELDDMFGMDNWEQAESTMQKKTADLVIEKGGIRKGDLRYLFAGDLLGQLIATSFGTVDLEIPLFGLYGACSTMGEALGLGAMAVNAGYADQVMSMASTNMIGVLKALGADNFAIRKIFLSFSVFLIGRGMVWGNIIGVALCFIQSQFHLFKLDPATYYVDRVPIEFNIWIYLLLNVCTLLVSVLMLVGPSFLVTRIHPAKSIRFE